MAIGRERWLLSGTKEGERWGESGARGARGDLAPHPGPASRPGSSPTAPAPVLAPGRCFLPAPPAGLPPPRAGALQRRGYLPPPVQAGRRVGIGPAGEPGTGALYR